MTVRRYTLVATVRNEARTIEPFIESLRNQTLQPDEIVVVDGASTDGTREILENYAARGVLRLISQPSNIAEGRNLGVAAAHGTHIAVTDAGCKVDPDWLAEIDRSFAGPDAPQVVAGNFRFECHNAFEEAVVSATFQPNRDALESARYYPSSRSLAFTKEAWESAEGYPEWLYAAEDTLFNIKLRTLGYRFAFARKAIVRWRPRQSWKALARQRINFSRGNARCGIGRSGYLVNLRSHTLILATLLGGLWLPWSWLLTVALVTSHVRKRLWPHLRAATPNSDWRYRLRVMATMEFVRLTNLWGFLQGSWDRVRNPAYRAATLHYLGVRSVADLELDRRDPRRHDPWHPLQRVLLVGVTCGAAATLQWIWSEADVARASGASMAVAIAVAAGVLAKSLRDFTRTGPRIDERVWRHYRWHGLLALARLAGASAVALGFCAGAGLLIGHAAAELAKVPLGTAGAVLSAIAGILLILTRQFLHALRFNPGLIVASLQYRVSHLETPWRLATPARLRILDGILGGLALIPCASLIQHAQLGEFHAALGETGALLALICTIFLASWEPARASTPTVPRPKRGPAAQRPNILMIGADTLRADRLGALGYRRALTPTLDSLAEAGTLFGNCYVPCARTAPSLASLFTGQWPQSHGIRDNFIDSQTARAVGPGFPARLRELGYRCSALSDWCGADLGKFDFGFDELLVPPDQWNLKYLIRQGPKDLRLLLSLFCQNPLGRRLLPEVHFLGGVPGSSRLGRRARRLLGRLAADPRPFLMNVFFSTTHPPFASEWPWYVRHADPAYQGESRFAMARLNDPFEIIRRQGEPRTEFDLDQIVDLYDGCVAQFDHEVGLLLEELTRCGLAGNTLVLVYSDHGMEFFEHDTWGQGNSALGEASPRIPLLIKDPRYPGRGVITEPIRSVDVAPTLLDLVGDAASSARDGCDLASFLRGDTALPQADVFNETGLWLARPPGQAADHLHYPELFELLEVPDLKEGSLAIKPDYAASVVAAKDRMVRRGRWKLVMQPATGGCRELLFDLEADPDCRTDLAAEHPTTVAELREALEAWWLGASAADQVSAASASMRAATDAHP